MKDNIVQQPNKDKQCLSRYSAPGLQAALHASQPASKISNVSNKIQQPGYFVRVQIKKWGAGLI